MLARFVAIIVNDATQSVVNLRVNQKLVQMGNPSRHSKRIIVTHFHNDLRNWVQRIWIQSRSWCVL